MNKQKGAQAFGNRDDAFSPPDQDGQDGEDEGNITFKHRIYVPKNPLAWDSEGRLLLFEVSAGMKRIPKLSGPSQIVTFATAFAMFDAYATLAFVKAFMFSIPFFALLTMSSYLNQQSGVIVAKIELIRDKDLKLRKASGKSEEGSPDQKESTATSDQEQEEDEDEENFANEVEITNLRGEVERIHISDIKPVSTELAKQLILQKHNIKLTFPVFVNDLLMIIDRRGVIHNVDLFKAVLNGYKIDMYNTQAPSSDKDDEVANK
jgi:hypothetical protein